MQRCFREPIPEILEAAELLSEAVAHHLSGASGKAEKIFMQTNSDAIRDWTESIWDANSPFVSVNDMSSDVPILSKSERTPVRTPNSPEKRQLIERDGLHCRFCGIPLVRKTVRQAIHKAYPSAAPWGRRNPDQHAALQAMWLQYDHVLPHARGGDNSLGNIVITCAPCNFGRMNYLLEEVGISDPFARPPVQSEWDGLEPFISKLASVRS